MTRPRTIVLVALTALACALLVYLQGSGPAGLAAATKLLASCGFLATAFSAGALWHRFGQMLFAGLVLSWFGDAFLIGTSQRVFLLGLTSFLLAHVAYIAAFSIRGLNWQWLGFAAVPIAVVAIVVLLWLTPHTPPKLVAPVQIYTVIISVMVVTAFGARGAGAPVLVLIGALLFFASDLSVAALRILQTDFPHYVWGLPTYYAGQLCIALGAKARHQDVRDKPRSPRPRPAYRRSTRRDDR